MSRLLRPWPVTIRLALEFDSADIQQLWWLPWFHAWRFGFRTGVLGLHVIVSICFYDDDFNGWDDEQADNSEQR